MIPWLSEASTGAAPASPERATPATASRVLDAVLAGLLLTLLALPLLLALGLGRLQRSPVMGLQGRPFQRLRLRLPGGRLGRTLHALGAAHWPVLIHVLRGDVAFVGPRLRTPEEAPPAATLAVRPGLVNPWFIRCRTAVAFGTEAQADADYLAQRGLRHDLGLLLRGVAVALLPAPAAAVPGRVRVGDVAFDNVDMKEAIARLGAMLQGPSPHQVSFVNPACVNIAAHHRGYRRVLARAALVLPDGIGIKIGSDLLGTPLKQNVNGTDLFPRLCDLLLASGASLYLLGGQPGVADAVAAEVARRWPGLRLAGVRDGYFSVAEEGAVAAQVRASGADVLLVARGVPSQDLFIDRYLPLLGVKVAMGVGGLFDFVSGRIARAPMWMRETGLEWVYRLMQEPGRMWRRYLVGNFSFLARVCLQRLGLRAPQGDAPALAAAAAQATAARPTAMVFATPRAGADFPVAADHPAALLPVGCQTLIEHVMDRLSQAAIGEVHVVVSDQPEALRAALGDGSRWGMRLHWHLVREPNRPYGPLRTLARQCSAPVLVGHAAMCPDAATLQQLLQAPAAVMHTATDAGLCWTGWARLDPACMAALPPDLGRQELLRAMTLAGVPSLVCPAQSLTTANDAEDLLRAPFGQPGTGGELAVPASWIRQPWGAMSPLARVHPAATVVGPVLIGAGCIVEAGAVVGPTVVLSRDVVVSAGTRLSHAVVLPGSYLGAELDLAHAVVNGPRVRHVNLGVESRLPDRDALLLHMAPARRRRPSWLGRALACGLLPLVLPALAWHLARCRWQRRPADWAVMPAVTGRDAGGGHLHLTALRSARAGAVRPAHTAWSLLAGVLDVAAGRTAWFGARPRSRGQWYALRPDWQHILAEVPVGLLHAPVWADDPSSQEEASAAADVFWAVQSPWLVLWTMLAAKLAMLRAGTPAARVSTPPSPPCRG